MSYYVLEVHMSWYHYEKPCELRAFFIFARLLRPLGIARSTIALPLAQAV